MFSATGALSLTGAGSISIANSMFSATGALSLPADSTITLSNNLFNFSGVLSASATNRLDMKYNTVNKTQFLLDGNLSATCNIQNNYFANPPAQNNITQDGSQKNIILVTRFITPDSVSNNVRYSSWNGFTSSLGQSMFSDSSNTVVSPSKDSTVAWDWQIPGDNSHGAWNGPNPLPVFNLFPPDSTVTFALPTGNAVFTVAASVFPRVLTASLGAAVYATALPDSVRSWFEKDTTLVLNGSARVNSISLPARSEGRPLLFAQAGSAFVAQSEGVESGSIFVNATLANTFIPAFAGQNTFRGSNVSVTGLGTDTTVRFDSVTRAGRTLARARDSLPPQKRLRPIARNGEPYGAAFATNAEGSGTLKLGLTKAGAGAPIWPDSLFFRIGNASFVPAFDSSGFWWWKSPFASSFSAALVERLAVGSGRDTVAFAGNHLYSATAAGHQLSIDSSASQLDTTAFPSQGYFSKPFSFKWPGRAAGDTLVAVFRKTNAGQSLFVKNGTQTAAAAVMNEDTASVASALALADSGMVFFLARKFSLAAGQTNSFALGPDSVTGLLSSTPGDFALDSTYQVTGLVQDTLRFLAVRGVVLTHLTPTQAYTVFVAGLAPVHPARLVAYTRNAGGSWVLDSVAQIGNRYRLALVPAVTALVVAERLSPLDTVPIHPAKPAVAQVSSGQLILTPALDSSESARTLSVLTQVEFVDAGGTVMTLTDSAGFDSSLSVSIPTGVLGAYRMGYRNFAGTVAWDATWTPAPLNPAAFTAAANAAAPALRPFIKNLIGYPQNMPASEVLQGKSTGDSVVLKSWNGTAWSNLPETATLAAAGGYLAGLPAAWNPKLDTDGLSALPVGMNLDSGWHCVADPLPFPIADARIGLDSSSVSYFYALSWTGDGDSAKPSWSLADTLKPFQGYMVKAFRPTQLAFDPFVSLPLGKPAAPGGIDVQWSFASTGQTAILRLRNFSRPAPVPTFFHPGFFAVWDSLNGSLSAAVKPRRNFFLEAPTAGKVAVQAHGSITNWAVWSPAQNRLLPLGDSGVMVAAGWNAFQLVQIDSAGFAATESELQQEATGETGILRGARRLGSEMQIDFEVPAAFGMVSDVDLRMLDVSGRVLAEKRFGPLLSGEDMLSLEAPRRFGLYFLQIRYRGSVGIRTATLRFMDGVQGNGL